MTDRPILFNTEMVKAILDGRKTQMRPVVEDIPADFPNGVGCDVVPMKVGDFWCLPTSAGWKKLPYAPGDLLWVQETWAHKEGWNMPAYRADWKTPELAIKTMDAKWKPSIHMPRAASRITLRVTAVRVERVQDIRDSGAMSEGIICDGSKDMTGITTGEPVAKFADLWDSINAKRGCSWQSNPWVWVVEFERVTP